MARVSFSSFEPSRVFLSHTFVCHSTLSADTSKACIDQERIEESLACLPIFLAGCNDLLILAGKTYPSRLWCVVELFVFMRMGGQRDRIVVKLLDEGGDLQRKLARFDANKARCFLEYDRQRLLAVIESGFGNCSPFNKLVRGIFSKKRIERLQGSELQPVEQHV